MSIEDEFRKKEVIDQVALWANEYEEAFRLIREFTSSDHCAWLLTDFWFEWSKSKRLSTQRKATAGKLVSAKQLARLSGFGVEDLTDLTRNEAQVLIDCLEQGRPEADEEDTAEQW